MSQLNHPKLGALKGLLRPNNVLQFHNLPFAVAERFGDPILRSGKLSDNVYDASKLGYSYIVTVLSLGQLFSNRVSQ